MAIRLSDEARQLAALFESETEATVRDCVIDDDHGRVLLLIKPGEMAQAIGPAGEHVSRVEDRVGKPIKLVEDAETPEAFVANALAPAAVYNVTISENDDRVAYVEVDDADRGAAIGDGGENIDAARLLAKRHFGVDDVELA
ncbi:NusA-like transcription termination signal-binding factor [Halobacteriales archaeon QH_6_66_25]|nr:MAG: NusA-like transcription termination signal-binding factor [Halobacteriales archaeon QH_6_66_25]